MTTLEQVRKAYEDLSEDDKKSFHQSIADRVHESIAAQERADGNKDSQTAADREHEALGAEHADGKGDVSELHETDKGEGKESVEKAEEKKAELDGANAELFGKMDRVLTAVETIAQKMSDNKPTETEKVEKAAEKYGMSSKPAGEEQKKTFTDEEVRRLLG